MARSTEAPLFDQVQERKANLASGPEFTNKVITLWYRPPEILLGAVQYGTAVDVWSAGCILAELMLGKPLFAAKTELDQLTMILEMIGPPKSQDTYDFFEKEMKKDTSKVPLSLSKSDRPPGKLAGKYSQKIPPAAMSLLEKTLEWDPRKRATASSALTARYFWSEPVAPANPAELGETLNVGGPNGHFHEFLTKRQRRQGKEKCSRALSLILVPSSSNLKRFLTCWTLHFSSFLFYLQPKLLPTKQKKRQESKERRKKKLKRCMKRFIEN